MYRFMFLTLLVACGSEESGFDPIDFEGGTFQMTTTGVNDSCFDGGFEVIFMPEGQAEPWGTTTELPSWANLPATYDISLQAPFDQMQVTVEAGSYEGEFVKGKLLYYPTVTREPFRNQGRLTDLMTSGKLFDDLELPKPNLEEDRFMLCGSPAMLKDFTNILDDWGFRESRGGHMHEYVIERAFVEK